MFPTLDRFIAERHFDPDPEYVDVWPDDYRPEPENVHVDNSWIGLRSLENAIRNGELDGILRTLDFRDRCQKFPAASREWIKDAKRTALARMRERESKRLSKERETRKKAEEQWKRQQAKNDAARLEQQKLDKEDTEKRYAEWLAMQREKRRLREQLEAWPPCPSCQSRERPPMPDPQQCACGGVKFLTQGCVKCGYWVIVTPEGLRCNACGHPH
jgi:hypothetical protein